MTEDQLDLEMRRQVRRGAVVVLGSSVSLIALFITFAAVNGPSAALVVGIAMFVVLTFLGVDAIVRFPRPRPDVVDGAVVLRQSRVFGAAGLLLGLLLSVFSLLLLGDADIGEQRRAAVLWLGPPVGVVVALASVALLLTPGAIRVGPQAVEAVRLRGWGQRGRVTWDDVEGIGIPTEASGPALRTLPVVVQGSAAEVRTATNAIAPTVWVLIEWLEHYRQHPDDRSELAGAAGVERLAAIEERLAARSRWPRWFTPPAP